MRQLVATDAWMLFALLVLLVLGEANLLAIGETGLALHQLAAALVGATLLFLAFRARPDTWAWLGRLAYVAAVVMLVAVAATGVSAYGARRWLTLGSLVLQPSELAKLGLLLILSDIVGVPRPRALRVAAAIMAATVPIVLTLLQPDLSTTALLLVIVAAAMLLARVPLRVLASTVAVAAVLAPLGLRLLRPYQLARLHGFMSGHADPQGAGWSMLQAHVAIASGGIFGIVHAPTHQLMAMYLPARQTDLAFASLMQQWGFAAGATALFAVAILAIRLAAAARVSRSPQAALLAGCLAVLLTAEVVVSVAGNLGAAPLAGVPFPFISYGGTATAAHLAAIGLVLSARRDAEQRRLWVAGTPARQRARPRLLRPIALGLTCLVAAMGATTWKTQQVQSWQLGNYGMEQLTRCAPLPAARGAIEDRHGAPLAVNEQASRVLAVPRLLLRERAQLEQLAALLGQPSEDLAKQLGTVPPNTIQLELARVPAPLGDQIAAAVPAVTVIPSQRRRYPEGALLGAMLGFTGIRTAEDRALGYLPANSVVGRAGLERWYDALLRGRDGHQCVYVDPNGVPVQVAETVRPEAGATLRLSIDLGLQRKAAELLQKTLQAAPGKPRGDEGAAVILDPRSGQLLALASVPGYDNNLFGPPLDVQALDRAVRSPGYAMLEHGSQLAVPPGSTFKLVVGAADAVHNAIPPALVIPTGYLFTLGNHTFHGWGYLPPQNLSQAIAWSNDVYFYKLALALGPERMTEMASQLGVGEPTGIDLPGEASGLLGTPAAMKEAGQPWYPGSTVIMGIGQGYVTATPLQVARWTSASATGSLFTPRLGFVARAAGEDTFKPLPDNPPPSSLPFASRLTPVRDGLRQAVTQGTGDLLRNLPIPAGGKTGTAEDPSNANGSTNAWFTSLAPFDRPEVVMTALVRGGGEGHLVAEPIVADLFRYYLANRAAILEAPPAQSEGPPPWLLRQELRRYG